MWGVPGYLLCLVVKKDGLNVDGVREDEAEGEIYKVGSGMDGEECNQL